MKKLLITGLLIASSNAYSQDLDSEFIELDDFQDMRLSSLQYPNYGTYYGPEAQCESEYENSENELNKLWEERCYFQISNKLN